MLVLESLQSMLGSSVQLRAVLYFTAFHCFPLQGKKGKSSKVQIAKKEKLSMARKTQLFGREVSWGKSACLGSTLTIRISSHRKVLLFQTPGLVQLPQLCSLLKLQPCWNQSTFVSTLPSVPLQSTLKNYSSEYFIFFSLSLYFSTDSSSKRHTFFSGFPPLPFLFSFFSP